MWANLILLFTLSLIPFTTAWMGENHFDKNPVALYGLNLLLCAIAFTLLEKAAIRHEGKGSAVGVALKSKIKEYASVVIYLIGLVFSFWTPAVSLGCYVTAAIIWLIPDTRIEKQIHN